MSRAHLNETAEEIQDEEMKAHIHAIYKRFEATEMNEIREETKKDCTLQKLKAYTLSGWPDQNIPEDVKQYYSYQETIYALTFIVHEHRYDIILWA